MCKGRLDVVHTYEHVTGPSRASGATRDSASARKHIWPLRLPRVAATCLTVICSAAALAATPSPALAEFGLESFSVSSSTSQAGAHPNLSFALGLQSEALGNPVGQVRHATVTLPPGLLGNPQATEKCTQSAFQELHCPTDSQVGVLEASFVVCQGIHTTLLAEARAQEANEVLTVASTNGLCASTGENTITIGEGESAETAQIAYVRSETQIVLKGRLAKAHPAGEAVTHLARSTPTPIPLYDLQAAPGHTATLGASVLVASILVQVDLAPDGSLVARIEEISTLLPLSRAVLTLWGVPADAEHDAQRCSQLEFSCGMSSGAQPEPFTINPTDCAAGPLQSTVELESWEGESASAAANMPAVTGCQALSLPAALSVTPATTERDTPSGYAIDLAIPQDEEPDGLATPALSDAAVSLPEGTSLSPSAAEGLQVCTDAQFAARSCPPAALVGSAEIDTPLLAEALTGGLYLGAQLSQTSHKIFLYAHSAGATIALAGRIEANATTGQVTAVFEDMPQLPFAELKLSLFGGPAAPLANPQACGPATSVAQIASYAGPQAAPSSTFTVDANGAGEPCPARNAFAPTFTAGTTIPLAAAFSPFTLAISREDGEQNIAGFTLALPNGLTGLLKTVTPCPEPQAAAGACSAASQLGTATIAAGAGPQPLQRTGAVYLTGPYHGAPFGLAVVVNANTAALALGTITLRARVLMDRATLALTIASDPIPEIVQGIPLRLRSIAISLDRPDLLSNPTSCSARQIAATIAGAQGATTTPAVPFAVSGCAGLRFAPRLSASTQAKASERGAGAGLRVQIANQPGPGAGIRSAIVELPAALRPRLSAIQGACLSAGGPLQPSACPRSSRVGVATVATPALASPLTGGVYLVAHGGRALPSLVALLTGDGITAELSGVLSANRSGSISAAFRGLPDIPIEALTVQLPRGPDSLLGAIASPCAKPLRLPYQITAQNGRQLNATVRIAVSGCPRRRR